VPPPRKPAPVVDLPAVRRAREKLARAVEEHPELTSPTAKARLQRFLERMAEAGAEETTEPRRRRRGRALALQLSDQEAARLERVAVAVRTETGKAATTGAAARAALLRGLDALEVELGLPRTPSRGDRGVIGWAVDPAPDRRRKPQKRADRGRSDPTLIAAGRSASGAATPGSRSSTRARGS
jgi:hypothetical protein